MDNLDTNENVLKRLRREFDRNGGELAEHELIGMIKEAKGCSDSGAYDLLFELSEKGVIAEKSKEKGKWMLLS